MKNYRGGKFFNNEGHSSLNREGAGKEAEKKKVLPSQPSDVEETRPGGERPGGFS
jgi:hypothetical protein